MCSVKEFDNYKELSSGEVLMGDDSPCFIRGMIHCQSICFMGVIQTLRNVTYILRFKQNLISLGTLDKARYGFGSEA